MHRHTRKGPNEGLENSFENILNSVEIKYEDNSNNESIQVCPWMQGNSHS